MFGRLAAIGSSLLSHAADAIAPTNRSFLEEFKFDWKCVTNFYLDQKDETLHIQSTNIPYHLNNLVEVLLKEEDAFSMEQNTTESLTGPCMEHLLQHKILETLYSLGHGDNPPGMRQEVLRMFSKLLCCIRQPLIPHMNVHRPVKRLMRSCAESRSHPLEADFVDFLHAVSIQLNNDPSLSGFFMDSFGDDGVGRNNSNTAPILSERSSLAENSDSNSDFFLFGALVTLMQSEDISVANRACDALLLCVELPHASIAAYIIDKTNFVNILVERLKVLYTSLPRTVDDACKAASSMQAQQRSSVNPPLPLSAPDEKTRFRRSSSKETPASPSIADNKRRNRALSEIDTVSTVTTQDTSIPALQSFLSWLEFVNDVAVVAHPLVCTQVVDLLCMPQGLLPQHILPSLLDPSESGATVSTLYVARIIGRLTAPCLLDAVSRFLLGEADDPEEPDDGDNPPHMLRATLIARLDALSDVLCINTLRLFEALLHAHVEHTYSNLILRNLLPKHHLVKRAESSPSSNNIDREAVVRATVAYLMSIVPLEVRSGVDDERVSQAYMLDAREAVENFFWSTQTWKISRSLLIGSMTGGEASNNFVEHDSGHLEESATNERSELGGNYAVVSSLEGHNDGMGIEKSKAEAEDGSDILPAQLAPAGNSAYFYEGTFLSILFQKLERMLDQPHEINLLVTSLIALLCQCPVTLMHDYLLDRHLILVDGTRSLYTILHSLCAELSIRAARASDFEVEVKKTRARLTSPVEIHDLQPPEDSRYRRLLEAAVVLDEFTKELSAITLWKQPVE